jgi:hypothetical protein
MSSFGDCIQRATNAGQVDRDRGARALEKYNDLVDRYAAQGQPAAQARIMAADDLMDSITSNTQKRRHTVLAQMQDLAKASREFNGMATRDPDGLLKAVDRAEMKQRALEQSFMSQITDILKQHKTDVLGRTRNIGKLRNVVRELHGQASGDVNAKLLADSFMQVSERARSLFNALGGDIGKLQNRGLAHTHDRKLIEAAGFDVWFRELYDNRLIDWSRIENFQTGKPFAVAANARPMEADARRFLEEVYEGITSAGWNTREPGLSVGGAAMYNRGREHRVLHFRDGDAWMAYNEKFGQNNPFEAMTGELRRMARDIALMEEFGPNPTLGVEFRAQIMAKEVSGPAGAQKRSTMPGARPLRDIIDRKNKKAAVVLRHLNGVNSTPHDGMSAAFFAGTRNLITAAQLGGAPLSMVTDPVTSRLAAKAVGLNPTGPWLQAMGLMTSKITREEARAMGYVFDTWFNVGSAHARFMGDIWSPEFTSRITNFVLRANGLSLMTDLQRSALRVTFSQELGEQAGRSWGDLPPPLRLFMENRGLTAAEWDALRAPGSMFTTPTGGKVIAPTWFAEHAAMPRLEAERLSLKLGAIIEDHVEYGIPTARARGRATILGDVRPGSFVGEAARSTAMYKNYSLSVMFGQIRRVTEMGGGFSNRAFYVAAYVAQMTLMGALAVQLKEIAKGRDPRPMDTPKFWGAAAAQGGGLGIFGDFFSSTTSRAGGGLAQTLAGPVVGLGSDIGRAVSSNIARAANGQDMLIGRDVANLARRYNPLATFQPLIPVPTRLAMDRMIWDQLQYLLDPDASNQWRQAEGRTRRSFGTQSWWKRGEMQPGRAPDLSNAIGGRP